jgi:hypothetical protein
MIAECSYSSVFIIFQHTSIPQFFIFRECLLPRFVAIATTRTSSTKFFTDQNDNNDPTGDDSQKNQRIDQQRDQSNLPSFEMLCSNWKSCGLRIEFAAK